MKLILPPGATSQTVHLFIQDSNVPTGAGLTGLLYNSAGLTAYYVRPLQGVVPIPLTSLTSGLAAYASGGFRETDATNMPGIYRFDLPDGVVAAGVPYSIVMLKGAANMVPVALEIQLQRVDANLTAIDGNPTNNWTATLTLKQLSLNNSGGDALVATGGTNGYGIKATGNGTGSGVLLQGGANGHGMLALGLGTGSGALIQGGTNGIGMQVLANGDKDGMVIRGGVGANGGNGLNISAMTGNRVGMSITGSGSAPGLQISGGTEGQGVDIFAGNSSAGIRIRGQDAWEGTPGSSGIVIEAGHANETVGGAAGVGISIKGGNGAATVNGAAPGIVVEAGTITSVSGNDAVRLTASGEGAKASTADVSGTVVSDAGNSGTAFKTDLTQTATDHWKDALIRITSGVLRGQIKKISAYNGSTKILTVAGGFTGTPAAGVTFDIINE